MTGRWVVVAGRNQQTGPHRSSLTIEFTFTMSSQAIAGNNRRYDSNLQSLTPSALEIFPLSYNYSTFSFAFDLLSIFVYFFLLVKRCCEAAALNRALRWKVNGRKKWTEWIWSIFSSTVFILISFFIHALLLNRFVFAPLVLRVCGQTLAYQYSANGCSS